MVGVPAEDSGKLHGVVKTVRHIEPGMPKELEQWKTILEPSKVAQRRLTSGFEPVSLPASQAPSRVREETPA